MTIRQQLTINLMLKKKKCSSELCTELLYKYVIRMHRSINLQITQEFTTDKTG